MREVGKTGGRELCKCPVGLASGVGVGDRQFVVGPGGPVGNPGFQHRDLRRGQRIIRRHRQITLPTNGRNQPARIRITGHHSRAMLSPSGKARTVIEPQFAPLGVTTVAGDAASLQQRANHILKMVGLSRRGVVCLGSTPRQDAEGHRSQNRADTPSHR